MAKISTITQSFPTVTFSIPPTACSMSAALYKEKKKKYSPNLLRSSASDTWDSWLIFERTVQIWVSEIFFEGRCLLRVQILCNWMITCLSG